MKGVAVFGRRFGGAGACKDWVGEVGPQVKGYENLLGVAVAIGLAVLAAHCSAAAAAAITQHKCERTG
jgi:hypothetical protein